MKLTSKIYQFFFIAICFTLLSSCYDDAPSSLKSSGDGYYTGLDENSNFTEIPDELFLLPSTEVPPSVNLTDKFPPIGDQGQMGSCVAWAMGYNMKSYLNAVDNGLTYNDLALQNNQFSPLDLFISTGTVSSSWSCETGTLFEDAGNQLLKRGVARMSVAPYSDQACQGSTESAWEQDAAKNKISSYRTVGRSGDIDISKFKNLLAQGRPIVIGSKLTDEWLSADFNGVMNSVSGFANPSVQHALHAMVLGGYDDEQNAFIVINSWGPNWGIGGYAWMDYEVAKQALIYAAVYQNSRNFGASPDLDGDDIVDPGNIITGAADLLAWDLQDVRDSVDPTIRHFLYNVYNMGDQNIPASKDWSVVYAYYNAYDANDFGLILFDYYTDDYSDPNDNNGPIPFDDLLNFDLVGDFVNWWNNVDLGGGRSISEVVYGSGNDGGFVSDYQIPNDLSGFYYLVLIADPTDEVLENSEENNYYYFSAPDGGPLEVVNGVIDFDFNGKLSNGRVSSLNGKKAKPESALDAPNPNVNRGDNINAYSPEEITAFLKMKQKNGELKEMIRKSANKGTMQVRRQLMPKK